MKILFSLIIFLVTISVNSQQVTQWNKNISIDYNGVRDQGLDNYENNYVALDASTNFGDTANKVIYSKDGGNSWFVICEDKHFNIDENFNPLPGDWSTRTFYAIDITSTNHIYIIGQETLRDDDNQFAVYPFIYKTNDRGKNWDRIDLCDSRIAYSNSSISMVDSLKGYLFTSDCSGEKTHEIYYTEDGFESMTPLGIEGDEFNFHKSFKALDKNTLFVGSSGYILRSTDGGVSWDKNPAPPSATGYDFISDLIGYSTGAKSTGLGVQKRGLIHKTTDGGLTWINVMEESEDFLLTGLDEVSFLDEMNGVAIGRMRIYSTSDGGKNWVNEEIPFEVYQTPLLSVRYGTDSNAVIHSQSIINTNWNKKLKAPNLNVETIDPYDLSYNVKWDKIEGAVKYEFQMAEYVIVPFPGYTPPTKFEDSMVFSVTKEEEYTVNIFDYLKYSKRYYLRVRAISNNDTSQWSRYKGIRTEQKPDDDILTTPKLIKPENTAKDLPTTKLEFKWFKQPAASKYSLIIRKELYEPNPETDKELDGITNNSFVIDGLEKNTTYFWYVVAYDKNNQSKSSGYRQFKTTDGVSSVEETNNFIILYPNPSNDYIYLENYSNYKMIRIRSLTGQIVLLSESQKQINISNLISGVYFITTDEGKLLGRFVKK